MQVAIWRSETSDFSNYFSVEEMVMRERILTDIGSSKLVDDWSLWYYGVYGEAPPKRQISYIASKASGAMLDVVTPEWKSRIAKGEILNNKMLRCLMSYYCTPATLVQRGWWNNGGPNEWVKVAKPCVPVLPPALPTWIAFEDLLLEYRDEAEIALAKAWDGVDLSEMQALASLGELPETIKWIGSLYLRMVNLIRMFSKKQLRKQALKTLRNLSNKQKISGTTDVVSNFWLEWRYAVRPLIFEMTQAVAALKALILTAKRQTSRGFHKVETSTSSSWTVMPTAWRFRVQRQVTRTSDYRSGVLFRIEADVNKLTSVWGLNQGFETFWELTPFSFIIDWFFNVGDVISSWQTTSGLTPLASWTMENHRIEDRYIVTYDNYQTAFNNLYETDPLPGEIGVDWQFTRRLPSPSRAVIPSMRIKLDMLKILDLATIGRSLLKGMVPTVAKRS